MISEQVAASEGNNASIDSRYVPQIGQEFASRDDAHHFFSYYGLLAGFSVAIRKVNRTQSKKRNGEIYKMELKCNKDGKDAEKKTSDGIDESKLPTEGPKRKTNVIVKTNCPVTMVITDQTGLGIW